VIGTHLRDRRSSDARQDERAPAARRVAVLAAGLLAAVLIVLPRAGAEQHRVFLDGVFPDWEGTAAVHVDPAGDGGPSGIDLQSIWIVDDGERLYLRFDVTTDLILQSDNSLSLYLDTDNDPATGLLLYPVGAELRWDFGSRSGVFFYDGGWEQIAWADAGFLSGPTHSWSGFEIALERSAVPAAGFPLFSGDTIQVMFHDWEGGGDWAPDAGNAISYVFDVGSVAPIDSLVLEPEVSGACRLVTYNVHFDDLFDPGKQPSFGRVLQAIDPAVIAFQEIYDHSASQTRLVIENYLGGDWEAVQINDLVLLTRSTILDSWVLAGNRAGAHLITPIGDWEHDLLIINAHLSCCDNDPARQEQVDAIMAFVRDARTPGGLLDLTSENPIVITGDMNFVGLFRQLETLLTGDIEDEATYGPDFAPDWGETDFFDQVPRQPTNALGYTWYNEWSSYWPGRLDFIIYSDSNTQCPKDLVLQTERMPASYLSTYGLQAYDTGNASDHLPHFADLLPASQGLVDELPALRRGWQLALAGASPARGEVRLVLTIPSPVAEGGLAVSSARVEFSVQDATGRLIRRLDPITEPAGTYPVLWDGTDRHGRTVSSGVYWVRARTPGGSLAARALLLR